MSFTPALFTHVQRHGDLLVARVLSCDNLHLRPALLSQAAARRLHKGLRALEAFLRRVLILLALRLEPGLKPRPYARSTRMGRAQSPALSPLFRVFRGEAPPPDHWPDKPPSSAAAGDIHSAPLLARLARLKALLAAPEARARRLAFHLSRRRPGPILAPDAGDTGLPRRYGTEVSAIYASLAQAILNASRARPPPLGPMPREGPRIRLL